MTKCIEFGLFGPQITYYKNGYFRPKAQVVISLIILKLYITLRWKHAEVGNEKVYGFYFTNDPARLMLIWGNYHKNLVMPWERVVLSRERNGGIQRGSHYNYYITVLNTVPKIFKRLKWFTKEVYEISLEFDKPICGYSNLKFNTESLIAIQYQIELQILAISATKF